MWGYHIVTCNLKWSMHFSADSCLSGDFFIGEVTLVVVFFSGDCLSFTKLPNDRFSFPLPSSGIDETDSCFLCNCFPWTSFPVCSLIVSEENNSFLLEALLAREGWGLPITVELNSLWDIDFDLWCLELLTLFWSIGSFKFSAFLLEELYTASWYKPWRKFTTCSSSLTTSSSNTATSANSSNV